MCRRTPAERTRPVFTAPEHTEIRASDLDRERHLEVLRENAAQGRIFGPLSIWLVYDRENTSWEMDQTGATREI